MDSFADKRTCTNKVRDEREGIFQRFREVLFSLQKINILAVWHLWQ